MSTYQIPKIGKDRALFIVVTYDGAKINNNTCQVVVGFKVVGATTIDLMTGKLIKPQSRNFCWQSRIVIGKETEAMNYNNFNPATSKNAKTFCHYCDASCDTNHLPNENMCNGCK